MALTEADLRYGSISLLAELTGLESSQFSSWINGGKQMASTTEQRISKATGVPVDLVRQAICDRRKDVVYRKSINRRIRDEIEQKAAAKSSK